MKTLTEHADFYKTDKGNLGHKYTSIYDDILIPFRDSPIKVLEIGVYQGYSLQMWRAYFTRATIYGYDIRTIKKRKISKWRNKGIFFYQGDQSKRDNWKDFIEIYGPDFDIVIDDGSHISEHILISLGCLWPYVKRGGMYFIEDLDADTACEAQETLEALTMGQVRANHMTLDEQSYLSSHLQGCQFLGEDKKLFMARK